MYSSQPTSQLSTSNEVDQDQRWPLDCLSATLDMSHDVRTFAEASLHQASLQPGFRVALSKVTVNKELPLGLRQLAAVLLKQYIKQHWQEDEETFIHPVVSDSEKAVICTLLLQALDDPHGKICTALGMAVASIAHYDWPELLPLLLRLISDQTNMNGVHGALKCLSFISDDLDDKLVPKLAPVLFPCLFTIVSSPHIDDKPLCTKALSIVYSGTSVLGAMGAVFVSETRGLMMPMLKLWMEQFSVILQPVIQSENPDDWSIRMKEASSIQGIDDSYSGRADSDGVERSLESFAIQLFEFLLSVVGNSKLVHIIGSNVRDLVYYTIAYLQMTDEQVHAWSLDANQYVADEDNVTCSCCISGYFVFFFFLETQKCAENFWQKAISCVEEFAGGVCDDLGSRRCLYDIDIEPVQPWLKRNSLDTTLMCFLFYFIFF